MESGLIFNIQRYSVHDGPGIRTTVFLKGCPLRCEWCHNPEGISPRPQVIFLENRCIGCGECHAACRFGAEAPGAGPLPARNQACVACGDCVEACPAVAREMAGRRMTTEAVLETVLQDRVFYDESGGGVTFSGGEPLMQPGFLLELLQACHAQGLHTAVDTSGLAPLQRLLAVAPFTDLFLYDIKMMDDVKHRLHTGVSNVTMLENLRALGRVHNQIWVRVPIIPGINDDQADLKAIARFAANIPSVRQVNLLPFHRTGLPKSARLGALAGMAGVRPPSAQAMAAAAGLFNHAGLRAEIGG